MPLYSGFLGSEGHKHVGETSVDIHYTRYFTALPAIKRRQISQCAGLYMTVVGFQRSTTQANGSMTNGWAFEPAVAQMCQFTTSLVDGGPLATSPHMHVLGPQAPGAIMINGQATVGFQIPWYYKVEVTHVVGNGRFYYYQHEERPNFWTVPPYMPTGKKRVFRRLIYGTQVQEYRRAVGR